MTDNQKPRLLVLGTGFAAFSLLRSLDKKMFATTVVSPRNHFLFTPLLPSTTVGTLEFRSIIEPVRRRLPHVRYFQARCTAVDLVKNEAAFTTMQEGLSFRLSFDILVIAVGAINNTYNIPGVDQHALFLKELVDARAIRERIIDRLERAAQPFVTDAERRQLLHIVVVGGGPTGVEFAAEVHDFVREDLRKPYASLIPDVSITILEAGPSILSTFDAVLARYTSRLFRRQQINVRVNSPVVRIDPTTITLRDGETLPYGICVWSTGVGPTPFVDSLPFAKTKTRRLLTDEFFRIKGSAVVYALGDCAAFETFELPATSQVAQQEGYYLAKALKRSCAGRPVRPFRYHHYGMLAYIGSNRALADLATVKGRGLATWIFWRSAYLTKLVSLKNKILVLFDWCKTLVFGRDISRF
jgi:NADH:ubiquinone reductase (non-electrogenic)